MPKGAFTSYFDVAQLVLYMFWVFFFALCWWLARENRREGYPLESDRGSHAGWIPMPPSKTYRLADGREMHAPHDRRSTLPLNAQPLHGHGGSAFQPLGNPMLAGVGPGSWTERHDEPERDFEGHVKIRPLALVDGFDVDPKDPDPRGMTVFDARGAAAGTVRDLWLDVPECQFRYLEVEVPLASGGTRLVLCPIPFARITRAGVKVHALLAPQFAEVPATRAPDRISLREEDRITGYYGGGLLYAEPRRAEALL
jgi:photosynthetic reaction center H subunit